MALKIDKWAAEIRKGNVRAISRAITAVEDRGQVAEELLRELFPYTGQSYVIGLTGAPGTGKSTLVDRLAVLYRQSGDDIGIIAVDPTSPFSGGSILGDRIRMQGLAGDTGVFIRSVATKGSLGGLSLSTADIALILDASGKRTVLIETVGVGQDEVDIVRLADCTLVLLVPGLGDDIQNMKSGLMEIADIFVLNKADQEGAESLEKQLTAALSIAPERNGWKPPVVRTVASDRKGINALTEAIERYRQHSELNLNRRKKLVAHWTQRLLRLAEEQFLERAVPGVKGESELERLASEVADRRKDPYAAVRELLTRAGFC